jgi:PEP-CTERM putative exosortase interaction domain
MNFAKTYKFARLAGLSALLVSAAHAQLFLSGYLTGSFTDTPGTHDTIYNAPDGSQAWIRSGVPETGADLQTAIEFNQKNFTNISGGLVADDIFRVTNGRTLLGTTATDAHFDLWLNLTSPDAHSSLLTPITFTIENTPNGEGNIDDVYGITASPIAPFDYAGYRVQFSFVAPATFELAENDSTYVGELYVTFTPVPEPSTYAAIGAALLVGAIAVRRFRQRRTFPAQA